MISLSKTLKLPEFQIKIPKIRIPLIIAHKSISMNKFTPSIMACFFTFIALFSVNAQGELLQSGPMVAYSTMKEVKLWVQTNAPAAIKIEYWNIDDPNHKFYTETVSTQKTMAYATHLIADQLEPGNHYEYALYINELPVPRPYPLEFESQPIWLWRGDAPDFSFATGSCAYINEKVYDRPGVPYGNDYQIFTDIHKKDPDFMLWLGDNVYLREADWNSETGILHRYTHTRSTPELQPMLANMHHYGIWDDHDYGPNNSDRSYHKKKYTEKVFKHFYPGLSYIFDEGTTSYFQWADCEFFLLDNRFWRTPNKRTDIDKHDIIGEPQMEWLLDALVNSYAPFKFVVIGGQFLSTVKEHERHINFAPEERQALIEAITKLKINGVIFLTGDVHHTELSRLDLKNGYPLYDLTISPLTSGIGGRSAEENELQVEGTLVKDQNYALLRVSGKRHERSLQITVFDSDGIELWDRLISETNLKFPKDQ
jgi:alkaline phosphatase D